MTKKQLITEWKQKISSRGDWSLRAAIRIYQEQTSEERASYLSHEANGRGFNRVDAEVITPIVERYLRARRISDGESRILMRRMPKYAGQLYKLTFGEKK